MPAWLIYGLIASLLYGSMAIAQKVALGTAYVNLPPAVATVCLASGVVLSISGYALVSAKPAAAIWVTSALGAAFMVATAVMMLASAGRLSATAIFWGLLQGVLWGGGSISASVAFAGGADASQLVPLYNTNTLVAVALGILLLGERPGSRLSVVLGACLITVGSMLVSR